MTLPTSWSNLTVKDFIKVHRIASSPDYTNVSDKLLDIAAELSDMPLTSLPMEAVHRLQFILTPDKMGGKLARYLYLKGHLFKPATKPNKWTAGQYIDISEYTKDPDKIINNMHYLFAALCVECHWWGAPKKKQMPFEQKADLILNMPVSLIYPYTLFFCNNLTNLTNATQTFLEKQITNHMKNLEAITAGGAGSLPLMP